MLGDTHVPSSVSYRVLSPLVPPMPKNVPFTRYVPMVKLAGAVTVVKNRRGIVIPQGAMFRHLGKTLTRSAMYSHSVLLSKCECVTWMHHPLPCLEEGSGYDKARYIQNIPAAMYHLSAEDILAGYTSRKQKLGKKVRGAQKWRDRQSWQTRAMGAAGARHEDCIDVSVLEVCPW